MLEARRSRLRDVQVEIDRWAAFPEDLDALQSALEDLRNHPKTPDELRVSLQLPAAAELRADATRVLDLFRVVETRYARPTINIGVSGAARMGKSTLLQSMSGLGDSQLPTGSGLPVTAVRSRIFHSPSVRRASLRRHTERSFLDEVVGPYHALLGLEGRPTTIADFRHRSYPNPDPTGSRPAGYVENLTRLREMQESLDTYVSDLVGGEVVLDDLDALRPWVAYPTHQEIETAVGPVPRRYLAVKDCRIDTAFPVAAVEQLGICDLPGLGEVELGADRRHVEGLRNEVDVVVVVKRAQGASGFWEAEDVGAMQLIDEARGFVDHRDFVSVVVNAASTDDPGNVAGLLGHIQRSLNGGQDGRYVTVRKVDAAAPDSVRDDLLLPLLRTLAGRLPEMDRAVLQGGTEEATALTAKVHAALADLEKALKRLRQLTVASEEDRLLRAGQLRDAIARGLTEYVTQLRDTLLGPEDDEEFVAAVEAGYRDVVDWIERGFDEGQEAWCAEVLAKMRVDHSSAPAATDRMNWIRVEIGKRFGSLDAFLAARIDSMWTRIAEILRAETGELLTKVESGRPALEAFASLLEDADEPCPSMSGAIAGVLDIRLEYRTQLYPKARGEIGQLLDFEVSNPATGAPEAQIIVDYRTEAGAELLYRFMTSRAHQVAHLIRRALLQEAVAPSQVIYAFVEQFDDAFIRAKSSPMEFIRLARGFQDSLWPGAFEGMNPGDARLGRVRRAAAAVADRIELARPRTPQEMS